MQPFTRNILATVRQPLLFLDERSVVRDVNPAFCRDFEVAPLEIIGRAVFEIDHGRWDVPEFHRLVDIVQAGGSCEGLELCQDRPAGKRVIVIDARQTHDDEGRLVALLAIDDVTDRRFALSERQRLYREQETRVKDRTAELETANKELEAFSYSVSHDLRAPLRAIDGFSAQLLRSYAEQLDERGQHYLRRVRAGTLQMGRLIDDLLHLSRLSRETLRREPVDVTALSTAIAEELGHQDPERRVAVHIEPGLACSGDPGLLKVVLQNLIANAWKFTGTTEAATIAVGQPAGRAGYFVRDNGVGFDMSHADKLFGAFQRLHPQQQFPGNGIGLALVQRIVHRHGGRVWAESIPGHGATFFFTLPAREAA